MLHIKQAVIVEGKYDKIKLSSIIDAVIIPTNGFKIFKDKETLKIIRYYAAATGIIILTDSDTAGFKIRSFIRGIVPAEYIKHAYIPDIFGKEKRKTEPSKEGKLGVEGVKVPVIIEALEKAGVLCEKTEKSERREITKLDLYEDGLSGKPDSDALRKKLLKHLDLPERLTSNALVQVLNTFLTFEEYKTAIEEITNG